MNTNSDCYSLDMIDTRILQCLQHNQTLLTAWCSVLLVVMAKNRITCSLLINSLNDLLAEISNQKMFLVFSCEHVRNTSVCPPDQRRGWLLEAYSAWIKSSKQFLINNDIMTCTLQNLKLNITAAYRITMLGKLDLSDQFLYDSCPAQ